jgi:transcriptional regulator with GAF, ATPase, and Fis domain
MKSELVVMVGGTRGETFLLDEAHAFRIGRDTTNDLVVPDWVVSREHCIIEKERDDFSLRDLESHNGTLVNDDRVTRCVLRHEDLIRVGSWQLRFVQDGIDEIPPVYEVGFEDSLATKSDIRLSIERAQSELTGDLGMMVKFGRALNELKEVEKLQRRLLEIILDFMPATRAAILIVDDDARFAKSVCVVDRDVVPQRQMQLSRTVTRLVLRDRVALLSNSLTDQNLHVAESLMSSRVTSVLCVPLSLGSMKGLLYLDSNNPDFHFKEEHLQEMTAIAGLIAAAVTNARQVEQLQRECERIQSEFSLQTNMIGECPAIRNVFRLIAKIAPSDSTTLLMGESGTGKELAARAIHQNSLRHDKPFIAINCAVLSAPLLESELFGHERGAFTDAVAQKKGKFELADGGTIFLDEIAELPLDVQAKLLRFLQEREFQRVGGKDTISVDVRVVAATNKNLKDAIERGKFRDDLFFRINVLSIRLPALRERPTDVPLLATHFITKCSARCKRKVTGISQQALAALIAYDWPGNIRELENAIERALVLGSTDSIQIEDLPETVAEAWLPTKETLTHLNVRLRLARQNIILEAIRQAGGNYTMAARSLGILPSNLHRMLKRLGIKDDVRR